MTVPTQGSKPASKRNRLARYCRTLLAAVMLSSGTLTYMMPALADGTDAGTEIKNTAVGSFENPNALGTPTTVTSNEVTVTVAEVAGITVVSSGLPTEAPAADVTSPLATQGDGNISPDEVVYYTFTITNTGNDATQFFIPDAPSDIQLNGTSGSGGTLAGDIEIIAYDPNGSSPTDISASPVAITAGGAATGTLTGIGTGSFDEDGSVTVRVPVRLDAGLSDGDVVKVVLGDTAPNDDTPATQNQDYIANASNQDVYTQDNAGTNNGDTAGDPVNGDAANNRKEASATSEATVGVVDRDFGDLPAPYSSLEADGGPSHFIRTDGAGNNDLFLGAGVTAETDAAIALGDATDDANDDGVTVGSVSLQGLTVIQGETLNLDVSATGADGKLNIWFDWDGDGTFTAAEQVATDLTPTGSTISVPNVTVPTTATTGDVGVLVRYSSNTGVGPTGLGGYGEVETYLINVVASDPALSLVKRVTAIGTTPETGLVNDGVADSDDDEPNWPTNYLQGTIDTSSAAPGEEIEYTVYFLSSGNDAITNLNICDMVPENTTYVPNSLQLAVGTAAPAPLTDGSGDDKGEFFAAPALPPVPCPIATNDRGAVVVNVADNALSETVPNATAQGTPGNSFGFVRFKVTVD